MDSWVDRQMSRWVDNRWIDDGQMDRCIDGQMNR